MKHPIWIFNSILVFFITAVCLFVVFTYKTAPERESLEPDAFRKSIQKDELKVNISKIYEDDLFGTYKKPLTPEEKLVFEKPAPTPPEPAQPKPPEHPKPQFLDPLKITLSGIIIIGYDESKNRAIIKDEKTSTEKAYQVGDNIEDAQIIKIVHDKVILLRSNGQQEIIYLREYDATHDSTFAPITGWEMVIQRKGKDTFTINTTAFLERVSNLAQFIELLDLTTVYQRGKSIGCRIGKLEENSLGIALGLQSGDIVTHVDNVPATDTPNRFSIYKNIIALKPNESVSADIIRNNNKIHITYIIAPLDKKNVEQVSEQLSEEQLKKEKIKT